MNWIALGLALYFIYLCIQDLMQLGREKNNYYIVNARKSTIGAMLDATVCGLSFYFKASGVLVAMNWFFLTIGIISAIGVLLGIYEASRHGDTERLRFGAVAFGGVVHFLIAGGFFYVFYALTW